MTAPRRAYGPDRREAAGALASAAFVGLASVRDVYFGGLFQRLSPMTVAVIAFGLCSAVFLPAALWRCPGSLLALLRRPRDLFWVNATSAAAWIAFLYALGNAEPLLVQILFAGVGPLSVRVIDRLVPGSAQAPLGRAERGMQAGLLATLGLAAAVAIAGRSGLGPEPAGVAALGVALALGAGLSISANTVLCRRLNDAGVDPLALVSVRFVGTVLAAAVLAAPSAPGLPALVWSRAGAAILGASLLLVVLPNYVNQVGVALASPLTVRVVLAVGPVLVFALELAEGRLAPSLWSLGTACVYAVFAAGAALARRRTMASAATAGSPHSGTVPSV